MMAWNLVYLLSVGFLLALRWLVLRTLNRASLFLRDRSLSRADRAVLIVIVAKCQSSLHVANLAMFTAALLGITLCLMQIGVLK